MVGPRDALARIESRLEEVDSNVPNPLADRIKAGTAVRTPIKRWGK